jgi:hypothetical protein
MKANQTEPRSLFLHIYSMSNSLQNCEIAYKFHTFKLLKIDTRGFAVHSIAENNTTRSGAHENDGQICFA